MQYTDVTDGQTDRHRTTAQAALCIASRCQNRAETHIKLFAYSRM